MKGEAILRAVLLAAACARPSHADSLETGNSKRLIITLDVPHDSHPELLCILGNQTCGSDSSCASLEDLEIKADHEKFSFKTNFRHGKKASSQPQGDSDPLLDTLNLLELRSKDSCEECRPALQGIQDNQSNGLKQYITCTRNDQRTNRGRIALVELSFDSLSSPAQIRSIDLRGNQATVIFKDAVRTKGGTSLTMRGGDYVQDKTEPGTNERITLTLNPRCTLNPVMLPGRVSLKDESQDFRFNGNDNNNTNDDIDKYYHDDHKTINGCLVKSPNTLAIWLPYQESDAVKTLYIGFLASNQASDHQDSTKQPHNAYEASWLERTPPRPLKIQHRRIGFSWRKDCLIGTFPDPTPPDPTPPDPRSVKAPVGPSPELPWSASCPMASLPVAGATCRLIAPSSDKLCSYRCDAPRTVPAFDLPTRVRFDRLGIERGDARNVYSWEDTLTYSGQELTSFLAPSDRRLIVEFVNREHWRSRPGDEIDAVELRVDSGVEQRIPVGNNPPDWTTIQAPNATCSSRVTVQAIGARSSRPQTQDLDFKNKNIVLEASRIRHDDWFYWALLFGAGFVNPRDELVYGAEHHMELFGTLGVGMQTYFTGPLAGAAELNLIYEPTQTAYGTVQLSSQRVDRTTVPYHRLIAEIGGTAWGRNREWEAGLVIGAGIGGAIHGEVEKVGSFHPFLQFGGLLRVKPFLARSWLEFDAGLRWGEHHEFFGSDGGGKFIADTFHGEPMLTDRALWQIYGGLRWRMIIR